MAADPAVFGGPPGEVGSGVVSDPANRTQIQIDVVVLAPAEHGRPRKILSLGEVKWDRVMDLRHVERLRRAQDLLAVKGFDTQDAVLACYSGAGSTVNCKPANAPTSVLSAWISSTRISVLLLSTPRMLSTPRTHRASRGGGRAIRHWS